MTTHQRWNQVWCGQSFGFGVLWTSEKLKYTLYKCIRCLVRQISLNDVQRTPNQHQPCLNLLVVSDCRRFFRVIVASHWGTFDWCYNRLQSLEFIYNDESRIRMIVWPYGTLTTTQGSLFIIYLNFSDVQRTLNPNDWPQQTCFHLWCLVYFCLFCLCCKTSYNRRGKVTYIRTCFFYDLLFSPRDYSTNT